jgi:ubiquitin
MGGIETEEKPRHKACGRDRSPVYQSDNVERNLRHKA